VINLNIDVSKIRALFIDFDGTLVDYHIAEKLALKEMFTELVGPEKADYAVTDYKNKNIELWSKFENGGITIKEIQYQRFEYMSQKYGIREEPWKLNDEYLSRFVRFTEIDEDNLKLLKSLIDAGYAVIIVSNGIETIQKQRFTKINLFEYIHDYITSETAGEPKPGLAMFEIAHGMANRVLGYQLRKDEICMIGDSKNADIKGAQLYGIGYCWITNEKAENSYKTFADSVKLFI
jgi:2-haloacid dehalogenase